MIRIAVVPERYGGVLSPCGSIRLSAFFDEIRRLGGQFDVRYLLLPELKRYRPDIVVWQRVALPALDQIEALSGFAAASGVRLIYDLDDNLIDIAKHGESDAYMKAVAAVEASLSLAHEVWVSTRKLAERVATLANGTVCVLPNALDPVLWQTSIPKERVGGVSGPFRMLYMGTRTHDEDFKVLEAGLEQLNRVRPNSFELTMVGVCADDLGVHRWLRSLSPPAYVGASYPAFVHWFSRLEGFDLGLAPLLAGRFNDCKSSIKVLDYAALGIPTLASDVDAYRDDLLIEGHNVFRVKNSPDAWAERIHALMDEPDLLAEGKNNARRLVGRDRFLVAVEDRMARIIEQFEIRDGRTNVIQDGVTSGSSSTAY
jgi:glycosyltransferase involved in cell wall biosynthesis